MKKSAFLLAFIALTINAFAEKYTIVFNSNENGDGSATDKLEMLVYSASGNCVQAIRTAQKVARAKPGYGIKGGTSSEKGMLTLGLDDTYHITDMTVYAATYSHKNDTAATKGFIVYDQTFKWEENHRTEIRPYKLTLNKDVDSIFISAGVASYNRWYVQKIEFEAADPHPTKAAIELPYAKVDFGSVRWVSEDEPIEDVLALDVTAKNVAGSISLALKKGKVFSLTESTLPAKGGEVSIYYSVTYPEVTKAFPIEDVLIAKATGIDGVECSRELSISLTVVPPSSGASTFDLDTTRISIGSMPGDYYKYAQGTADSTLKNHIGYIICCGRRYRYGSGARKTWDAFYHTDRDTVTNEVLDMYSNNHRYFNPDKPTASVPDFDIEHMLPKSWWGGDVNPAYCDLYHLVPGDYSANRSKSNHAPGIPADSTFNNGSFVTGSGAAYGLTRVFCPADEYKGDFARAYFYIAACYGDSLIWLTTGEPGTAMTNEGWQEFRPWLRDLLVSWHRLDPVSKKELDRAIEVNKIQGNRNPFIDYPELVEYIWGNKQGQKVDFRLLEQSYGDAYDESPSGFSLFQATEPGAHKQMRDGSIVIIRNASVYTTLGQRIQ